MQINEFIEATSRLEKYYAKEYTKDQLEIMYDELKHLDISRYKKLIAVVMHSEKYLPKLPAFFDADKNTPYEEKKQKEKVYCKKCNSTGYVTYTKVIKDGTSEFKNTYVALCDCGNARQYKGWEIQDKLHSSNFHIPSIRELGLEG